MLAGTNAHLRSFAGVGPLDHCCGRVAACWLPDGARSPLPEIDRRHRLQPFVQLDRVCIGPTVQRPSIRPVIRRPHHLRGSRQTELRSPRSGRSVPVTGKASMERAGAARQQHHHVSGPKLPPQHSVLLVPGVRVELGRERAVSPRVAYCLAEVPADVPCAERQPCHHPI